MFHWQITKKLAGDVSGTASWATTVGNEFGQVLMTVLTVSEGTGLDPMARGIVKRYTDANETPPKLLYVDRDCCSPRTKEMFQPWDILVKLDLWHYMRRFAMACTTESHPLYGTFMSRLSSCIFQWDKDDLAKLQEAKRAELKKQHQNPTPKQVDQAITKDEMAKHCRRTTRGVDETTRLIRQLLDVMLPLTDACGVPLLDADRTKAIWDAQKKHIACVQDPPGLPLYTTVGSIRKGGVELNVYRCARGSTSLESFHLHLARFIPGYLMFCVPFVEF